METNQIIKIHKPFFFDITKFIDKEEAFETAQLLAFNNNWFWNSSGEQTLRRLKDILNFETVRFLIFGLSSNNTFTYAKEDYFFNSTNMEVKGLFEVLHCEKEHDTWLNIVTQLEQGVI